MGFLGLGTGELVVILIVLLLFFGKDKLPELSRSIGKSFSELKKSITEFEGDGKSRSKRSGAKKSR